MRSLVFDFDGAGLEHAALRKRLAHVGAAIGVVRHGFHDDVLRAGKRLGGAAHLLVRIHEGARLVFGPTAVGLRQDALRERAQTTLQRDGRLGASLRPVRRVQIFELRPRGARFDAAAQVGCEGALLFDGGQDCGAACIQLPEDARALGHGADLDLVQGARRLFAVARDERNRRAFTQQSHHGDDAAGWQVQVARDSPGEITHRGSPVSLGFTRTVGALNTGAHPGRNTAGGASAIASRATARFRAGPK